MSDLADRMVEAAYRAVHEVIPGTGPWDKRFIPFVEPIARAALIAGLTELNKDWLQKKLVAEAGLLAFLITELQTTSEEVGP